jgi:hypothetical protein
MPTNLITLSIEDAGGDTSPVSVYVEQDGLSTETDLSENYAHVFWDAIRPLINGVLVDVKVSIAVDFSGWTNNTPSAISDIEEKIVYKFSTYGGNRPVQVTLPTALESILENGGRGKFVDFTDSDVNHFWYVMTNHLVDGGIDATDSHGSVLKKLLFGEQSFGKG